MTADQVPLFEEPTLTVAELSAGLAGVIRRAYPDEIWVRGEIANLKRTSAGHAYFDLAGEGACLSVTLFDTDRQVVNRILQRAGGGVRMSDGTEVRIRARVSWFAKRGTVSLRMLSIDPAYTLGRLAEERESLLRRLHDEGVVGHNRRLPLAAVPLRVGLITSMGSAAAADFLDTLESSGMAWQVHVADARVQGNDAERSVVAALVALAAARLDVVCVVRGGGARTDLAAFDSEVIARTIAGMPIPVFTGIGHEIDSSVADLVAHTAFKTPTACAAALVERVEAFLARCASAWTGIARSVTDALDRAATGLDRASGRVVGASRHHLRAHEHRVQAARERLAVRPLRVLDTAERQVGALDARVGSLDPVRVLARGWTVTRRADDGRLVRTPGDVAVGDEVVTTFAAGSARSRVESVDG